MVVVRMLYTVPLLNL